MRPILLFVFLMEIQAMSSIKPLISSNKGFQCADLPKIFKVLPLRCFNPNPVGAGMYSSVYVLENTDSKVKYAAKVMLFNDENDRRQILSLLESESKVLEKVKNHSNVISIIYSTSDERGAYQLMEYGHHGTLTAFKLAQPELFSNPYFLLKLIQGIAKGLKAVHKIGFTVSDIKPDNIVIMKDLTPKIIDLGFAQPITGAKATYACGTPKYKDPRMYDPRSTFTYDEKSDVYSLGMLLYTLSQDHDPSTEDLPLNEFYQLVRLGFYVVKKGTEKNIGYLICQCRQLDPDRRPTTQQIINKITEALEHSQFSFIDETKMNVRQEIGWKEFNELPIKGIMKVYEASSSIVKASIIKVHEDKEQGKKNWKDKLIWFTCDGRKKKNRLLSLVNNFETTLTEPTPEAQPKGLITGSSKFFLFGFFFGFAPCLILGAIYYCLTRSPPKGTSEEVVASTVGNKTLNSVLTETVASSSVAGDVHMSNYPANSFNPTHRPN